jgi:hypothetical protein
MFCMNGYSFVIESKIRLHSVTRYLNLIPTRNVMRTSKAMPAMVKRVNCMHIISDAGRRDQDLPQHPSSTSLVTRYQQSTDVYVSRCRELSVITTYTEN